MILIDVNILIYAHRPDSQDHDRYRRWLENVIASQRYGVADLILSAFLRIVTNRRIYKDPTPLEVAIAFLEKFRNGSGAVPLVSGPGHWDRFISICRAVGAGGNLVPDAFLTAMAMEAGCEWVTTDRDFGRFPGVRFRHPFN